jgi:hypothetical protein
MNKEVIGKRLATLKEQLKQIEANGNALVGAIQDCEYWLAELEKAEAESTMPLVIPLEQIMSGRNGAEPHKEVTS